MHFHSKSEHKIDGVQYDGELHIVFPKKPVESTGKPEMEDMFCVVGILFKIDDENAKETSSKILNSFSPESPEVHFSFYYLTSFFKLSRQSSLICMNYLNIIFWPTLNSTTTKVL